MADIVEEIKAKLDIESVVSAYVQLKKAGRNLKGLCPFHSEKTSSFVVSPEKQICHCFGCNKGGDIFTFIQEIEGVEFPEALQILADKAGVKVEKTSKLKAEKKSEKEEYFEAHRLACEYFQKNLLETEEGKKVLEYLYKRGLKDETIEKFEIGFASDKYDDLHPYLLKKGISKDVLVKSGFVVSKGIGEDGVYDKFRGRLMFPIHDYLGRVCGFGGRALKKDQMPKYLNSPENAVYNKSKVLYGLFQAKQSIKENDTVVLVEGYFDVVVPSQEGVSNVVAVSGIALTEHQVTLLKRLTTNAITCFDFDNAGYDATKRAYALLANQNMTVRTVSEFEEKDPAEYVLNHSGDKFAELLNEAEDFVHFYIDKLMREYDISSVKGRKSVLTELLPLYKNMGSAIKDFYIRDLASKLNTREAFLYDEIENFKLPVEHPARAQEVLADVNSRFKGFSIDYLVCGIFLNHPSLFKDFHEKINFEIFEGEVKDVYKALFDQYNSARNEFKKWNFKDNFLLGIKEKLDVLMLYVEESCGELSEVSLREEVEKLIDKSREMARSSRLSKLQTQIQEAEKLGQKDKLLELLHEQQKVLSGSITNP